MVRVLSLWAFPLLIMFMFQSLTWVHYFILVIPPLCILAALPVGRIFDDEGSEKKSTTYRIRKRFSVDIDRQERALIGLFILYVLISTGFSTATVIGSHRPIEDVIADDVRDLTSEGEMVLCGDPIIALMADRDQPPEATNLAKVRYPELTSEDLTRIVIDHDIRLVVISYHLSSYEPFCEWIFDNWTFRKAYENPDRVYEEWKEPGQGVFLLYTT
jgi:hypothetical protein